MVVAVAVAVAVAIAVAIAVAEVAAVIPHTFVLVEDMGRFEEFSILIRKPELIRPTFWQNLKKILMPIEPGFQIFLRIGYRSHDF